MHILNPYINYFSDDEIVQILESAHTNEKIFWIINEPELKEFFEILFEAKRKLLQDDTIRFFKSVFRTKE